MRRPLLQIGQGRDSMEDLNVDRPSGIDHMGKTNFKEFEEKDRRRVTLTTNEPTDHSSLGQWIPIAVLSIALLACIGTMIWLCVPLSRMRCTVKSHKLSIAMTRRLAIDRIDGS